MAAAEKFKAPAVAANTVGEEPTEAAHVVPEEEETEEDVGHQ